MQACAGMKKLMSGCRALADRPEFRAINNLRSIDAIAVRVWFDRKLSTRFPANVLAGFENSAGGTFFNLNELQVMENVAKIALVVTACVREAVGAVGASCRHAGDPIYLACAHA